VQLDVEDDDNGFITSPPPFEQLRCHATRGPDQPTPGRGFLVFFLEFFCLNTFVGRRLNMPSHENAITVVLGIIKIFVDIWRQAGTSSVSEDKNDRFRKPLCSSDISLPAAAMWSEIGGHR
jgi:hypothetical protein